MLTRTISQAVLDIIKECEGLRLQSYLCPAGVWTVGYGHTRDVYKGMVITRRDADLFLGEDVEVASAAVSRLVSVPLSDNQFSVLVSFTFNLGARRLAKSTLLWQLNRKRYGAVPAELAKWKRGGGKILPGLVKRRALESALWMRG